MPQTTSYWLKVFAAAFIAGGIAVLIHQVIYWNVIFEPSDFLHHENFSVILIGVGIAILVTIALIEKKNRAKHLIARGNRHK